MPAIKLTNDVVLDASNVGIGIDTNNVLKQVGSNGSESWQGVNYTATQDCWALFRAANGQAFTINSKTFLSASSSACTAITVYLKKGDVFACGSFAGWGTIYAAK